VKFGGWQRLTAEYAKQFGIETLNWRPQGGSKVVNRRIEKQCTDHARGGDYEYCHPTFDFSLDSPHS